MSLVWIFSERSSWCGDWAYQLLFCESVSWVQCRYSIYRRLRMALGWAPLMQHLPFPNWAEVPGSIWWHHPLHNEGKYVLEVLWRGSYVALLSPHGFLWRCLPVAMRGWHVPVPATSLLGPALRRKCRLLVSFRNMWEWYYTDQLGHLFSIWQLTAGHPSHCQPWALPRQNRTLVWHPPAEARAGCEGAWLEVGGNFWFSGAF